MFSSVYRFGFRLLSLSPWEKSEEDTLWPLLSVCFYNMMYRRSVRILPYARKIRHVSDYFQFWTYLPRKHHDCSLKFILTQKLFFNVDGVFRLSVVCFCLKILTSPSHHLPRPQVREHFGVVVPSSYDLRRREPPSHNQISWLRYQSVSSDVWNERTGWDSGIYGTGDRKVCWQGALYGQGGLVFLWNVHLWVGDPSSAVLRSQCCSGQAVDCRRRQAAIDRQGLSF